MKQILFLLLILSISLAFAEEKDPKVDKPEEPFIEKAKVIKRFEVIENQKTDENLRKRMRGEKVTPKKIAKKKGKGKTGVSSRSLLVKKDEKEYFYTKKKVKLWGTPEDKEKNIIATLRPGKKVELLYEIDDHGGSHKGKLTIVKVKLKDGREGFMKFSLLQKKKPKIMFSSRDIILDRPKRAYVTASSLYMREEPKQGAYSIYSLSRNAKVKIVKYSDNQDYIDGKFSRWAYVQYDDSYSQYTYRGWVYGGYLSDKIYNPVNTSKTTGEDPKHIYNGSTKYIRSKVLHLRDEPSKYGTIIATYGHGTRVSILKRDTRKLNIVGVTSIWVKIQVQNTKGWVFGAFLSSNPKYYISHDMIDRPFRYPIRNNTGYVSSPYGMRIHPVTRRRKLHSGIDLATGQGNPVFAAGSGRVTYLKDNGRYGYGRIMGIKHPNGLYTFYAHLYVFKVRLGQNVKTGDIIGLVGSTGYSTGAHLHFEVRTGPMFVGSPLNPKNYIPLNTR